MLIRADADGGLGDGPDEAVDQFREGSSEAADQFREAQSTHCAA